MMPEGMEPAPPNETWRALADALQAAMTETGVEPDPAYVRATAQAAVEWLDRRGLTVGAT